MERSVADSDCGGMGALVARFVGPQHLRRKRTPQIVQVHREPFNTYWHNVGLHLCGKASPAWASD